MKSLSRRAFLKTISQAGLLCAAPSFARAAETLNPGTVTISILHTTDLHGHILPTVDYSGNPDRGGLARCVTQIRRWRRHNANSILIDVGDVYQGTDVGLRSKGELMIDLFNYLKYDAWVVGNHEFDWGIEPFEHALERSTMPVLAANTLLEGKPAGEFSDEKHPFAKIQPFMLKEIAGIKVAIVGVTTPGMPFWFRPAFARGIDFQYPVEPVRRAIAMAKSEGADAIVLTGHMGLKPRSGGDDFANTVMALTSEFPEAAVFIAGHTHQAIPSRLTNGVLFTQADHFGIHVGRVDLLFDRNSKKLLHREAICELMDSRFGFDHTVVSRAKPELDESEAALAQPIGELAETLHARSRPGEPSDLERLVGTAIMEALRERDVPVDGAMHGVFDERSNFVAGPKTVNDIWNVLPYENYVVTADLLPDEIKMIMEEVYAGHERRNLLGFEVRTEGRGYERRITSMTFVDGRPLDRGKKYVIAFNTFDSRSAGHRFMKLRTLLETPSAKCTLHQVQTRDALIDYFRRHRIVHKIAAEIFARLRLKKRRAPLAYLPMRAFAFSLIALLSIVDLAWSQVSNTPSGQVAALPMYRPILLGQGPKSLIDRIDTQDLIKKGQKDALIMFNCAVRKDGGVEWSATYRGTPGSDFLKQELQKRLSPASDPRFIPAVYNHRLVDAIYYGAVTFAVVDGKPRLRIFSNQEAEELAKEHDFIGPQPFFGNESKFTGLHYPPPEAARVLVDGNVELKMKIDVTGNLQDVKVVSEQPPLLGFADAASADFRNAKFIPAFRDGKPVACDVTLPVFYKAAGF